jgi:hypothetical protein
MVLEAPDERLQATEGAGLDAVTDARTVDLTAYEPGVLEHLEVLRDRGLGERQLVYDVAADAGLATDEQAKDLDAGGMAHRLGEHRQLLVGIVTFDRTKVWLLFRFGSGTAGRYVLELGRHRIVYLR